MNPEQSRRVDAALDQLRSLQRPYPHQPVLLDTLGSTARVAHLEETAATTEIPRPTRNSTKLGASRIVRKGRAPASGRRLRSAAVDSFKRDENEQKAPAVAHDPVRTACPREVHAATH